MNKKDALCILGLNIINEKIYVTLWFWLVILACMTAVYLIYVVAIIAVPGLRRGMVTRKAQYILDSGLGGGMFWDLPSDDFKNLCGGGTYPLIRTVSDILLPSSSCGGGKN